MKRLESDFRSIYDSDMPEDDFDQEMEDFEVEIARIQYYDVEYIAGCEEAHFDDTVKLQVQYYDEDAETDDDELEPEQYFFMQENFPLIDAIEIYYRIPVKKHHASRQTSHKKKVVESVKCTGFTGDYGYGYDSDFA